MSAGDFFPAGSGGVDFSQAGTTQQAIDQAATQSAGGAIDSSTGGYVNLQTVMQALNALPQSASSSFAMAAEGLRALNEADRLAQNSNGGNNAANTPGEQGKRDTIRAHLTYYGDNPAQLEQGFYDIRALVGGPGGAFVLYNAAVQAQQDTEYAPIWPRILSGLQAAASAVGQGIAKVATAAAQAAGTAAGAATLGVLQGLFQNPIGLAFLGIGAFLLYEKYHGRREA